MNTPNLVKLPNGDWIDANSVRAIETYEMSMGTRTLVIREGKGDNVTLHGDVRDQVAKILRGESSTESVEKQLLIMFLEAYDRWAAHDECGDGDLHQAAKKAKEIL